MSSLVDRINASQTTRLTNKIVDGRLSTVAVQTTNRQPVKDGVTTMFDMLVATATSSRPNTLTISQQSKMIELYNQLVTETNQVDYHWVYMAADLITNIIGGANVLSQIRLQGCVDPIVLQAIAHYHREEWIKAQLA